MARRNSQAKMRPSGNGAGGKQVPWWIWFLGGLFCGLGLSALVLMKQWAPQLRGGEAQVAKPAAPADAPAANPDKPKYDFYSVLPEMEVVIPDEEVAAQAQRPEAAAPTGQRLFLQAGSFKGGPDAEAMKARLALLGQRASVVAVTVNGATWHRVRVGPFSSARELDDARRALDANGIAAIALREKSE